MTDQERERRARRQAGTPIAPGADHVEPRDPAARAVPRKPSTALLFAIPAVLIVLLGLGWMFLAERDTRDETMTPVEGTTGETAGAGAAAATEPQATTPPASSDLQMLANPEQYAGRTARFSAVPVTGVHGERSFSVGKPGSSTLVLLDPSVEHPEGVMPGQRVDLAGTFERAPSGEELQKLNLGKEDRDAVEEAEVYLRATEVAVQGSVAAPRSHTPQ